MLIDTLRKPMHLLDRKREKHKVKFNNAYSNQPTLLPREKHTQQLQDKSNKQNVPNENVANKNIEECSKESISHLEIIESGKKEKTKPIGSLPLCFESFEFIRANWPLKNLLEATHESHAYCLEHQQELVEDEIKSEMEEK